MLAQSVPSSCPSGHPVDEIIAEIHKQQDKKKHRNSNPLPDSICIGGWCRGRAKKPAPAPESTPRAEKTPSAADSSSSGVSSSKLPVDKCDEAMELALEAAHNVEVGDYSFDNKNYTGALLRYKDADEEKPEDAAIHVRLGRVFEKLGQLQEATDQYKAALDLAGPEEWSGEAKTALARLDQHAPR